MRGRVISLIGFAIFVLSLVFIASIVVGCNTSRDVDDNVTILPSSVDTEAYYELIKFSREGSSAIHLYRLVDVDAGVVCYMGRTADMGFFCLSISQTEVSG